jgi:hypothetical protein
MVGSSHVMLAHQARRIPRRCRYHAAAATFALPLRDGATALGTTSGGACTTDGFEATQLGSNGRLERVAGEPVFMMCAADEDPVIGKWCGAWFHGAELGGVSSLERVSESHTEDSGLGMDVAANDGVAYMAVDMGGQIVGQRYVAGSEPMRRRLVGNPPEDAQELGTRIEITENTRERTVIYFGSRDSETASRVVMGPDGTREGAPERAAWPTTPLPFEVIEDRETRRSPRHLRLVRADGSKVPIEGIPDEPSSFSPAVVDVRGAHVLVFSEGLNEETRIWGALLDVENASISSRFRISAADAEAGHVHADAYGDNAVVAWGQDEPEGRALRLAQIICQ